MAELVCDRNVFEGTVVGQAEDPSPVIAYEKAERDAVAKARNLVNYYKSLQCPTQPVDCRRQVIVEEYVASRPARVTGYPSRRRGYYFMKVVWAYRVIIDCKRPLPPPPAPPPQPPQPPQPPPEPIEEPVEHQCPDPIPGTSHRAGESIGSAASFAIPIGGALTSNPTFLTWEAAGPAAELTRWLQDVICDEGCEAYWDPEPQFRIRSMDTAGGLRCWWELTNDIEARCRPRSH